MEYSGIILAGGKSSRLGFNKISIDIGGIPLFIGQIFKLGIFCDEVIISCSDENHSIILRKLEKISEYSRNYSALDIIKIPPIKTIPDSAVLDTGINKKIGPIAGIYSGLLNAKNQDCLVIAFDMPFISYKLFKLLISKSAAGGKDAVIIKARKGIEALYGLYSKNCIKIINKNIKNKIYKIIEIFPYLEVEWISEIELKENKIDDLNYFNINTSADHERFKALWNEGVMPDGTNYIGSGSAKKWEDFFYRGTDKGIKIKGS